MSMLDDAIQAIRMGNREEGRRLLEQLLETEENNEQIWLWLTSVVDSDEDREVCLENVLALNPQNVVARRGLEALRQGTFNINDVMSQVLEPEEVEEPGSGRTFLDEFELSQDNLDGELVMPSTMADGKAKTKAPKSKSGGGINVRRILLIAFVLLILCALGAAVAFNVFLGGGQDNETGAPPPEQPGQAAPGGGEEAVPEATATATPTDTPTPTNTPDLSLPTRRPTEPPTPTSTPVVPPTPG